MAEIEVVSEGGRRDEDEERRRQQQQGAGEPDPVVDVYSAAAYGDLERLRGFVEQGGAATALREPDGNGYHALQWAALNNYPHVALYIVEVGLGLGFPPTPRLSLRPCRYPASSLLRIGAYSSQHLVLTL
jgi:palmitoyltransferase ZDHHC13/17